MAEKRIINLTEASDFVSDDYLVVDSPTSGTRKISKSIIHEVMENSLSFTDPNNDGNVVITLV